MNEELEQKVDLMKREIDALQIVITGNTKPWYQNISTLLSVVALLFSFGTTYVSYRRTAVQDIQSSRQELRGLLQRLAALPKENVDIRIKYVDDPASMNVVGGFINQENALLARQAAELAKKLPSDLVSGTEYYAIAIALQNSYDLSGADEFLKYSAQVSKDFNTEIAAIRSTANLQFVQGRPEAGRIEYQKALNIFSKYPGYDPFTKTSTNVWTELAWAFSEAGVGSLSFAHQHVENAKTLVNSLPRGPGTDMLNVQVTQAEMQFASGQPLSSPVAGSQLGIAPLSGAK
jgi:hypothetical protein